MSRKTENKYRSALDAFEELQADEKARFMVQAVLSTVAEGIDRVSRVVADSFDDIVADRDEPDAETEASAGENGTPPKKSGKSKTGTRKKKSTKRDSSESSPDSGSD